MFGVTVRQVEAHSYQGGKMLLKQLQVIAKPIATISELFPIISNKLIQF